MKRMRRHFLSSVISIINAFRAWSGLFARVPSSPELMNRAQGNARLKRTLSRRPEKWAPFSPSPGERELQTIVESPATGWKACPTKPIHIEPQPQLDLFRLPRDELLFRLLRLAKRLLDAGHSFGAAALAPVPLGVFLYAGEEVM